MSLYLNLELSNIIHRPGLIIVVIVGNGREAAGTLLGCDTAVWEILHGPCAADSCFWNPHRYTGRLKVLTLQNFNVD